jgi:hypothetical protein
VGEYYYFIRITELVSERRYPCYPSELGQHIHVPAFTTLLANFLADQLHSEDYPMPRLHHNTAY